MMWASMRIAPPAGAQEIHHPLVARKPGLLFVRLDVLGGEVGPLEGRYHEQLITVQLEHSSSAVEHDEVPRRLLCFAELQAGPSGQPAHDIFPHRMGRPDGQQHDALPVVHVPDPLSYGPPRRLGIGQPAEAATPLPAPPPEELEELRRRDHAHAPAGLCREVLPVAGDDAMRQAAEGTLEKRRVVRIRKPRG